MTEVSQIISTLKRQLKFRGLTYRDVAQAMELSEASVKRLFANKRWTVDRLVQISQLLGLTLGELLQESVASSPQVRMLTKAQEAQLVSDDKLLLVLVCALNHWSVEDILTAYRLTRAECLKRLLALDHMGVLQLMPGDRVRLRIARDFDWLPDGPIRRTFLKRGLGDFLGDKFDQPGQTMAFAHAMLTPAALAELQLELRQLQSKLASLHEESARSALSQRHGIGLLLAAREWEPLAFKALKRTRAS